MSNDEQLDFDLFDGTAELDTPSLDVVLAFRRSGYGEVESCEMHLSGVDDEVERLSVILPGIKQFLHELGFDYVADLIAVTSHGNMHVA